MFLQKSITKIGYILIILLVKFELKIENLVVFLTTQNNIKKK